MFDAFRHTNTFEHERSINKEFYIPYDKSSLAGHSVALDTLIDEYYIRCGLEKLIPTKTPKKADTARERVKRNIRSLFWHMLIAASIDDDCYVMISLRDEHYRKSLTDNPHHITREISKIIGALERHGVLQRCNGFLDRKTGQGKQTRIRASLALIEDLKMLPGDTSEAFLEPAAVSIRKGVVGAIDEQSAQHMARMKSTIRAYNEFMRLHTISIPDAVNGLLVYIDKKNQPRCVRTTRKTLTAIYHAGDPTALSYGRIHGGAWQNIPAHYRRTILIDGEATVELDYSAQIIHMVASIEGIQLTGDPYAVPQIFSNRNPALARDINKTAVVVLLNASDWKSAFRGIRSRLRYDRRVNRNGLSLTNVFLASVIENILRYHPFLEKYANTGKGKYLFMHDAEIARGIIQTFLDHGKVVLPIHDGFIVTICDQDFLKETMYNIWFEKFQTTIPIKTEI